MHFESSMQRYWVMTYAVQIFAVILMLLALFLPWHTDFGSGLQIMGKFHEHRLVFSIANPFPENPDYVYPSPWWIVWVIPFFAFGLGLRAMNGIVFKRLEGQQKMVFVMGLLLFVSLGWYGVNFYEAFELGFFAEVIAAAVLIIALILEFALPEQTAQERYILSLPPDHPTRLALGYYRMCRICGAFVEYGLRTCPKCGRMMLPDD